MTRKLTISTLAMTIAFSIGMSANAQEKKNDDNKQEKIQQVQQEARTAFQDQKFKIAAKKFRELTELAPKNANAWFFLGYCLHMNGDIDKAIPAHKKAASFKNSNVHPIALYNLGCAYSLKKNKKKSLYYLEESLRAGFNQQEKSFSADDDLKFVKDDKQFKELEKILETPIESRVFAKRFQPTCPVSGEACKKEFFVEHNGGQVYFCCADCVKAFKKDAKKYSAKANYQLVLTKQAECVNCPFSGKKIVPEMTTTVQGVKVGFCNEGCLTKVKNAGDKQIEMIFNDEAFQKGFKIVKKDKK